MKSIKMDKTNIRECLSEHDKKVLDTLFVPVQGVLPSPSNVDIEVEIKDVPEILNPTINKAIKLELEGIKLSEEGKLDEAIEKLDKAIGVAPHRCSAYNNKAQVLRLLEKDEEALIHLDKALKLSSHEQVRTRCQAFCQRGILHRKMNNTSAAKKDLEEAAKLGSKFAANLLVEINPYAALCNQIFQAAFEKLK